MFWNNKDDWGEISEAFEEYADDWDYKLVTLDEQKQLLLHCGFRHVEVFDKTKDYVELLEDHLENLKRRKDQILQEYREADLQSICSEWSEKLEHFTGGEQVWGYFTAKKIFCWMYLKLTNCERILLAKKIYKEKNVLTL